MATKQAGLLCCFALLLSTTILAFAADDSSFVAPEFEEYISTEAGRVDIISEDFWQLKQAGMRAAMISVEPDSMSMPMYADAPALKYIIQGQAMAGLISPMGMPTNVWCVMEGDVVVVPGGWTWWVWNNNTEALKMMAVSHTKEAWHAFFLTGAQNQQAGGITHGFSKEALARAWNIEEGDVDQLRGAAQASAFVKVSREEAQKLMWEPSSPMLGDYVYSMVRSEAEIMVKEGGSLRTINSMKMPVLHSMAMSLCRVHLEKGATMAPHFHNGHRVIHFVWGAGHMEMAYPNGGSALNMDVKKGDTIIVPSMYPITMWAGEDKLTWVSFATTDMDMPAFLAGSNSLYHAMPRAVLKSAWNIEEDVLDKAYYTRRSRYEIGIFPPQDTEVPLAAM